MLLKVVIFPTLGKKIGKIFVKKNNMKEIRDLLDKTDNTVHAMPGSTLPKPLRPPTLNPSSRKMCTFNTGFKYISGYLL